MTTYSDLPDEMKPAASRYLKRMYSNCDFMTREMNAHDLKMIHTMTKMNKIYSDIKDRKSKSITISKYEAQSIDTMTLPPPPPVAPKVQQKEKPNVKIHYCQAIKMDGNVCNSKVKACSEFCGRHSKRK